MSRRRLVAFATTLAIAWTALWPLVSTLNFVAAGEAMPLCHQAGMMVSPDEAPPPEGDPAAPPKQHCPLCVMAFLAVAAPPVVVPEPPRVDGKAWVGPGASTPRAAFGVALPPSRAPPAIA